MNIVRICLSICLVAGGFLLVADGASAWVWNQKHLDYDGCNTCHNLHGSPSGGGLLEGVDTESTCRGCHGVAGPGPEAAIHDPAGVGIGAMGYITCRECHDSYHDEGNVEGVDNIKMVGYDWDPIVDPGKSNVFTYATVRVELSTTLPGDPPVYKDVVFADRTQDFKRGAGNGLCQSCHEAGPAAGSATDLNDHQWGDCTLCHMHSDGFAKRQCVDCHDQNFTVATTAPKVVNKLGGTLSAVGSHLRIDGSDPIIGLSDTDWTVQCIECHAGHRGDVLIPNPTDPLDPEYPDDTALAEKLGIAYWMTGGVGLGGAATSGASEAEICWNCHDIAGVSEWGVNTDTNGSAANYDFGGIYDDALGSNPVSNWVSAWWISGTSKFAYKTGRIQSTHSVNFEVAAAGVDTEDAIRCSYCHDVHELARAQGDSATGKPFLRGTWMGSPYREDGAPQAGDMWTANGNYGAVPRGGTQSAEQGGYQIDQNNDNPTTGGVPAHTTTVDPAWSLSNSAGLCALCHGSDVDNMNWFGLATEAWVGVNGNGHSNAAIGGSGGHASDIFSMAIRNPSGAPLFTGWGSHRGYPRQSYGNAGVFNDDVPSGDNTSGERGYGFRSVNNAGFQLLPQTTTGFPYAYEDYNWGASVDNTLDSRYHKFSCSKCHNPHASRLPRLMITNCLDTKHNDWDDQASISTLGSTTDYAPENRGVTFAMATSAQNCHRLADKANFSNATGDGWNLVTPWTTEGVQDNPDIP